VEVGSELVVRVENKITYVDVLEDVPQPVTYRPLHRALMDSRKTKLEQKFIQKGQDALNKIRTFPCISFAWRSDNSSLAEHFATLFSRKS
jgi:hypothetical protein